MEMMEFGSIVIIGSKSDEKFYVGFVGEEEGLGGVFTISAREHCKEFSLLADEIESFKNLGN